MSGKKGAKHVRGSLAERLAAKSVDMPSGCREWIGAKSKRGYGSMGWDGKIRKAHRLSWVSSNGPIPDGMDVLHTCDNPPCIKIDHLFLGTNADNVKDRHSKGRTVFLIQRGEKCGASKLTEEDVRAIRLDERPFLHIARSYNVTDMTIHKIKKWKTWRHVQ